MASNSPQAVVWERSFQLPSALKCPRCSTSMWSETSFVRHVRNHYPVPPKEKWVCSVCGETSHSKQSIAQHYRTHQTSGSRNVTPLDHSPQPIGPNATISPSPQGHPCAHCEASFPSKTGLRNHERARHQPQVSATLSREATTSKNIRPPPTRWSEEEVAKFLTAVNRYGLKQTTLIAQSVGLRTIQQVSYFKSRYKKLHPIWALKHLLQTTVQTNHQGTQSSPSVSPDSSPLRSTSSDSPTKSRFATIHNRRGHSYPLSRLPTCPENCLLTTHSRDTANG